METIYYNGKIITMAEENAESTLQNAPEALKVKNGVITDVGELETLKTTASKNTHFVDLQGKCLMPGFIDPHGHAVMAGQMSLMADLSQCESFVQIIAALKAYIAKNRITDKGVVIGFGYDHNFLAEQAHPDKTVLDQVSTEIPIFIMHVSAHLSCANSAALRLAGITAETANPEGGMIGKMSGSSEPSGYLEEAAMQLIQKSVVGRFRPNIVQMLRNVQKKYLENGITTIQDGATTKSDFLILKLMSALGMLKLDVVAYPLLSADGGQLLRKNRKYVETYRNHLKIGGYKLVLDGSPQGRSAWMSQPYLGDDPSYCGYPWLSDEKVNTYTKQAVSEGRQLLAHCNGDAASQQFLDAYRQALDVCSCEKDLRPVMIHCQTVRNDQLDRMAEMGVIASIFVGHVWYWGDVHMKNFGPERGNHISPVKDAIARGVHVNFHQDPPVTRPDMLHSVWCAVNRISRGGQVIGEAQKVDVYQALRAVTAEGAYQYFEEKEKGTLEKGKIADMVVLSASPLEVDPMEIRNIQVLKTIKGGKCVFEAENDTVSQK